MTVKTNRKNKAMSLLDDEKESLSSNTYVRVADALVDIYKAEKLFTYSGGCPLSPLFNLMTRTVVTTSSINKLPVNRYSP